MDQQPTKSPSVLSRIGGTILGIAVFFSAKCTVAALLDRPKGATAAQVKAEVDSGELAERLAKRTEANPREAWATGGTMSVKLKSFERSGLLELGKSMRAVRSLGVENKPSPTAEHTTMKFEGEVDDGQGTFQPVRGQMSELFFDDGAVVIMLFADHESYADSAGFYASALEETLALTGQNHSLTPSSYLKLKGWTHVPEKETDAAGGVLLIHSDPRGSSMGVLIALRKTPKELADALRKSLEDPANRAYIKDLVDKRAAP